jgi:CelD/BcsL family acetyltransferase involved in cellulose biosynthesis
MSPPFRSGEDSAPAATSAIRYDVVERVSELESLREDWDALLCASPCRSPFSSFVWVTSWLECLGTGVRPFVVVVRDDERVAAIAPLVVNRAGVMEFIGSPQSDYADILLDGDPRRLLPPIVEALRSRRDLWKQIVLEPLRAERSCARALLAVLDEQRVAYRLEQGDLCPAMVLEDVEAARRQYSKSNLNNYVNWFRRQGDFGFEAPEDLPTVLARLEDLFDQHRERWRGTSTPSSFSRPEIREFYRRFVERMHGLGWIRMGCLRLDDHFPAMFLYFAMDGVYYMYKPSYSLEFAKRSPGQVILRFVLEEAVREGVGEIDFTRGDEGYKSRFANAQRQNLRVILYRSQASRAIARLRHALWTSRPADLLLRNTRVRSTEDALLRWYRNR